MPAKGHVPVDHIKTRKDILAEIDKEFVLPEEYKTLAIKRLTEIAIRTDNLEALSEVLEMVGLVDAA